MLMSIDLSTFYLYICVTKQLKMAKWSVSEEMDEQGRKSMLIQQGRKKLSVKMNEGEADKLVRFILKKFND